MQKTHPVLMTILLMLPALSLASGDPEAGKTKAYTCTGCHGIPGYKNTYPTYKVPKLGGQNEAYLESALDAYRSGQRPHKTMGHHAKSLDEADIADIVAWLSSIEREPAPATLDTHLEDKTQACQACHGADGLGADPSYPVLAGQHQSYIAQALKEYRDGTRKNAIMGGFASALSDQDIKDLSAWYAALNGLQDLSGSN